MKTASWQGGGFSEEEANFTGFLGATPAETLQIIIIKY